mmetsp:Transcript_13840/g.39881  ORF Transcript_13840/g.39881 Transcript_13840/m.39881 type:complete len:228 (+) Transcript_13840:534-1217(+)
MNGRSSERETNDGLGIDGLGDLTGRNYHRIRWSLIGFDRNGIKVVSVMRIAFNAVDNALLHGHRLFWVHSCRRFRTQHDGIGTIINGRSNVAGFGPSRSWTFNHAFQHLSSNDDRSPLLAAFINNCLLQNRNIFRWALNAKIATSDHNPVALSNKSLQVISIKTRGFLDLRHDARLEITFRDLGINDGANLVNICWLLNERESDPIDTDLQHVVQITSVLWSQGTDL